MDVIYSCIIFVIVFQICVFIYLLHNAITSPTHYYINGDDKMYVYTCYEYFVKACNFFTNITKYPYVIVLILFIIMYIVFLVIIIVIPPTGLPTLFIPVRELLLKIYPLPDLIKYGVFDFFDNIINLFTSTDDLKKRLRTFFYKYILFTKDGTIEVIKIFNPDIDTNKLETVMIETLQNYNRDEKEKKISDDVNVCISNNSKFTPPNESYVDSIKTDISNIKTSIECNLKSTTSYISADI